MSEVMICLVFAFKVMFLSDLPITCVESDLATLELEQELGPTTTRSNVTHIIYNTKTYTPLPHHH